MPREAGAIRRALGRDPSALPPTRACPAPDCRCATRPLPIHNVKQRSLLRSRGAFLRPGFLPLRRWSSAPKRGAGGAPEGGSFIRRALVKARTTFARRGRPGQTGTGLSALHPGDFGPAPRAAAPELPPGPSRGRPSLPGVAPGARRPRTSRARFTSRGPGRHSPLRLQDRLRRRPSMSEDDES
jgi:hypothetical protein